jgi:hypothetical protein
MFTIKNSDLDVRSAVSLELDIPTSFADRCTVDTSVRQAERLVFDLPVQSGGAMSTQLHVTRVKTLGELADWAVSFEIEHTIPLDDDGDAQYPGDAESMVAWAVDVAFAIECVTSALRSRP